MTRNRKAILVVGLTVLWAGAIFVAVKVGTPHPPEPIALTGSVLQANRDPKRQTPLAGVRITALAGLTSVSAKSDAAGFFSLTLQRGAERNRAVVLTFELRDYQRLEMTAMKPGDQLYIARMQPLHPEPDANANPQAPAKIVQIKNVRIRYSFKGQSTVGVGSLAKQFSAPNQGNVPCANQKPCSPDGRWKATTTILPLDAEERNEFRNVRVACIAGPCAFTKIDTDSFAKPERKINIPVLNWSDTTTFVVEADRMRTATTNQVRHSYPFIVGDTMNFALPASSAGPSVEADVDGQPVVYPLGPAVLLSWATCSVEVSPDENKIYRCLLKSGYQFQQ